MAHVDLEQDMRRYIAEAPQASGRPWVTIDALVEHYTNLPQPNNWDDIRATLRSSLGDPRTPRRSKRS